MASCEPWYIRIGRPLVFTAFRWGAWRLLGRYSGDFASMRLMDRVFWAYKREEPLHGRRRQRRMLARRLPAGRTELAAPTAAREVSLLFLGDIMPLTPFTESAPKVELGTGLGELFQTDVVLANLEGPIGDSEPETPGGVGLFGGAPRLAMTPSELDMHLGYLSAGTIIVSTANNHAWDLGADGIRRTLDELVRARALPVGTRHAPGETAHKITTVAGLTIGLVPFTFGTNGLGEALDLVNVAPLNEWRDAHRIDRLADAVSTCRTAGCDLVVASLHWGLEFEWFPVEQQIHAARMLVDAGADVIWGHHPHVIQPVELHRSGASGRTGLIMYSTGNLVTPVLTTHSRLSLAVRVTVTAGQNTAALRAVDLVPMVFSTTDGPATFRIDRLDTLAGLENEDITGQLRITVPPRA